MIVKSKTRPTCAWCGEPFAKKTRVVFVVGDVGMFMGDDEHVGHVKGPAKSWEDCVSLTNHEVTSVRYAKPDPLRLSTGRRISSFTTWDGESYKSTGGFFCNSVCAVDYGTAAAKAGFVPFRRRKA